MCWWAFTGVTHVLFQGFFLFTPDFFTRNNPNYFDELCKSPFSLPTSLSFHCPE
jgi:cholestenol delta-isomerase